MAPNGTKNVRWLSYQPPIASKPYPTITVSTGNALRNYPKIWPYTDCPVWTRRRRLARPSGAYWQSSNLSRSFGTSPISLTLSLYTECNAHSVVICKGIGSNQNTPLMQLFQGNHVRTNECVRHGQNVAGPGWEGTSTGNQSRDWEWNQWHPRGTKHKTGEAQSCMRQQEEMVYTSPFCVWLHSKFVCFVHVFCSLP